LINQAQFFVFNPITGNQNNLPLGTLAGNKFNIGAGPADANDYFSYDPNTGVLAFDRDGTGAGFSTTQVAQLATGLAMTNANIVIV
jgi:hypothetical protein